MTSKKTILIDLDHTLYNVSQEKLYVDALDFITYAKKYGEVFLFTEGDLSFQKEKVKKLGLDKNFGSNIKIYNEFEKIEIGQQDFDGKEIVLIDDKPDVINKAINLNWTTIRIRRGKYKDTKTDDNPTYEVKDLESIIERNLL